MEPGGTGESRRKTGKCRKGDVGLYSRAQDARIDHNKWKQAKSVERPPLHGSVHHSSEADLATQPMKHNGGGTAIGKG